MFKLTKTSMTVLIIFLSVMFVFGVAEIIQGEKAKRDYLSLKGQLIVLDDLVKKSQNDFAEAKKLWAAEKENLQKETTAALNEIKKLKGSVLDAQKEREDALKKIESLTADEQVRRLQNYFGSSEVSLLPIGVVFTLKAANQVDRLWITREFSLVENKRLSGIIAEYETKVVPNLNMEIMKVTLLLTGCEKTLGETNTDLEKTRAALKSLEKSLSLRKWKHIGEGVVVGTLGTFILQNIFKK